VVERSGGAQTSVCFCSGFYWSHYVEFSVGEGLYSFFDTVIVNRGQAAITIREPVLFSGWPDVDGAVDGGVVVVDGRGTIADRGDWAVGQGDGI
jgi:hypothetical protein